MKYLLIFLCSLSLLLYIAGAVFYFQGNEVYQEKAVGFATLLLFFLIMPLFLWMRYDKKFLEKENEKEQENL